MVVAAVHHDDLRAEGADPPKSLHLHIDLKGQKVLEALLCQ